MERFKVCEKEFKTKAFSKEGLSQAPKEDPKEKERNRVRKWIATSLETLSERKDVYEAELETINSAKKKKKDSGAAKWEELIERCRFHEEKLELILRLIDNATLTAEDVEAAIKDQFDYLLECMGENNYDELDGMEADIPDRQQMKKMHGAMLDKAVADQQARVEIHGLTRAIRAETEPEDRVAIMEMVWMVVLADGELHEYESQLIRRLAGLLYVADIDSGRAARRARARLSQDG